MPMKKPPKHPAAVMLGSLGGLKRRELPKKERVRLATIASKAAAKARKKLPP